MRMILKPNEDFLDSTAKLDLDFFIKACHPTVASRPADSDSASATQLEHKNIIVEVYITQSNSKSLAAPPSR
jgi:hypothetical protein